MDLRGKVEVMREEMHTMQQAIIAAQHTGDTAIIKISGHEDVCAVRYASLDKSLEVLPTIHRAIASLARLVYIGVGIWVALPVVAGSVYGVVQLIKLLGK